MYLSSLLAGPAWGRQAGRLAAPPDSPAPWTCMKAAWKRCTASSTRPVYAGPPGGTV